MFLRKKPNESGSTSVQVIVKTKNRKQRVVKTIGSSRDTDKIERLMVGSTFQTRMGRYSLA